jgi:hypothetical protein
VVDALLPGQRYVNFGVATTLGYPGYYAVAQHMLERHASIRTLVLYVTMLCGYPRPSVLADNPRLIGTDLVNDLIDPMRAVLRPPTLALREGVLNRVYYMNGTMKALDAPRTDNRGYAMFRSIMGQAAGWARETDNALDFPEPLLGTWAQMPTALVDQACPKLLSTGWDWPTLSWRTHIDIVLNQFADLAARHDARLVVIANPIPEGVSWFRDVTPIDEEVRRVAARRPEIVVAPIEYWPPVHFSTVTHVGTPSAIASSARVARILAPLVGAGTSPPPPEPAIPDGLDIAATAAFSGYAWDEPVWSSTPPHRPLRPGRSEALLHARIRPGGDVRLTIEVPPDLAGGVRDALTASVFGVPAPRVLDGGTGSADRLVFLIPASEVARYNGFLEILLSLRGLTAWPDAQTTERPAEAGLRAVRFILAREATAAAGVSH